MTESIQKVNEVPDGAQTVTETRVFSVAKNVINLYAKPDTSSEVVTQSLMNAKLRAEKEDAGFVYVVGADCYRGWADSRHLVAVAPQTVSSGPSSDSIDKTECFISALWAEVRSEPTNRSELLTKLVLSTFVELVDSEAQNGYVQVVLAGDIFGWINNDDISTSNPTTLLGWDSLNHSERKERIAILGKNVLAHAEKFMGVPYLWGGCSPFGIDCSGLVQVCYQLEGLQLLRDADLQFEDKRFTKIEEGNSLSESMFEAGDLLVFGSQKNITHIGIASDDGRFIHASGRQANFGTYYDHCSAKSWGAIYLGAVRLSSEASIAFELA